MLWKYIRHVAIISELYTFILFLSFLSHFGLDICVLVYSKIFLLFFWSPLLPYCWRDAGTEPRLLWSSHWQAGSPCRLPPGYILLIDIRLHFVNHSMLHIYLVHETCCGSALSASKFYFFPQRSIQTSDTAECGQQSAAQIRVKDFGYKSWKDCSCRSIWST